MTNDLNNFLETDHVELSKSPMFTELVQNLKMTPQEQIEQMLWDNDEYLGGDAYEDIITSEYDSIVSVLDQAIEAYKKTDIYEITDDNEEQVIGTYKDKMNALANYLRRVANDIEEKEQPMLFTLKDTTVEAIYPKEQDEQYVEATCPTCGGDWEPGLVSVEITFGNGDQYVYERYDDAVETHNLSDVIDYLFTHLNEFPRMTQRQFIDHLTDELDKRFGYID